MVLLFVEPEHGSARLVFGSVPAFVFVETFEPFLPVGLGFAAGAMLWMVAAELLPEAVEEAPVRAVAAVGVLSTAAMVLLQAALL